PSVFVVPLSFRYPGVDSVKAPAIDTLTPRGWTVRGKWTARHVGCTQWRAQRRRRRGESAYANEQRNHHGAWEADTMKVDRKRKWNIFGGGWAPSALGTGIAITGPSAYAGGMIKVNDDQWISLGMGLRTSFNMVEDGSASGSQYSNTFGVNN